MWPSKRFDQENEQSSCGIKVSKVLGMSDVATEESGNNGTKMDTI